MKVHRTDTAVGHLDAIHRHVSQNSAQYAQAVVDRLTRSTQRPSDFPYLGADAAR